MLKPVNTLTAIALTLLLSACLYRPDIQQGNIVTPAMLAQVKVGMTQDQVRYALGTPVLVNTFDPNHWEYVYTYKQGGKTMVKQNVSMQFSNGVLQSVQSTPLINRLETS